jgi:hypothetical protein
LFGTEVKSPFEYLGRETAGGTEHPAQQSRLYSLEGLKTENLRKIFSVCRKVTLKQRITQPQNRAFGVATGVANQPPP